MTHPCGFLTLPGWTSFPHRHPYDLPREAGLAAVPAKRRRPAPEPPAARRSSVWTQIEVQAGRDLPWRGLKEERRSQIRNQACPPLSPCLEALQGFTYGGDRGVVFGILRGQVRFLSDVLGPARG